MTHDEIKEVISETVAEAVAAIETSKSSGHPPECLFHLTETDVSDLKFLSSFLRRCRNAVGNFVMVVLVVLFIMGVGGILFLASGGQINLFKLIGIGN